MSRTVVVGGGLAGISAALALRDRGHDVTLVERRPFIGGKAFSFEDASSGHSIDNGQHAFLSAYRNTLTLLDRLGTRSLVAFQSHLEMVFLEPGGQASRFAAQKVPAPAHLLAALLRLGTLSPGDRLATVAPALRLLALDGEGRRALDGQSFAAWLARSGQSPRAIRAFWEPLALAAVNGSPGEISAYMALQVLALGFLGSERTSRLGFATRGLSALVEPFEPVFSKLGGRVLTGREVRDVRAGSAEARWSLVLRDGGELLADDVVLAVPPWRLEGLMSRDLVEGAGLGTIGNLRMSPIISIQITLDRPVVPYDVVALLDSPIHWVFSTGRMRSDAPAGALALTISSAAKLAALPQAEIGRIAQAELARFFPPVVQAQVHACRVIKEMDATLACEPGSDGLRPEPTTRLPGLFVAGSWTRTGLPGTLEGAVISGLAAAEAIERERGQVCSLVQPLPEPGGLGALLRWVRGGVQRSPGSRNGYREIMQSGS